MSDVLEVRDLWKSYAVGVRGCSAQVSVLRGVSFRVARGERVGIVGARGAGKTTLLHCIAGLRRADRGEIRIAGPAMDVLLLLDEGLMDFGPPRTAPPDVTLHFARELAGLRGRVERVLHLRDGRVAPLDSPFETSVLARRVAESSGPAVGRGAGVR